jgi:5-methyltetrahydropteroyltriglutamate--homocysteine methyltransferase
MTARGLLTTQVGSLPKPEYLQRARNAYTAGKIPYEELHELELRATREWIKFQEEIGIDIIVDGEMYRGDMVEYFADHYTGMGKSGLVRSYGNRYYRKPIIQGKVEWPGPVTVDMWTYAQSLTDRPVKGMLTGPYTMVDWSFDEYYDDRRQAVLDMARVVNQEARALEAAGARYIQIDEPAVSTRPQELPLAIEGLAIASEGLTAHTFTHICYGDFISVFDDLVRLPVDQIDLETANSGFDILDLVKQKGFNNKEVGFGVVDIHSHLIESVDEVKDAIRQALEVFPPERLYIDPDCGLKTRTVEEAQAKLRVMMDAVHQVRKEIGIA